MDESRCHSCDQPRSTHDDGFCEAAKRNASVGNFAKRTVRRLAKPFLSRAEWRAPWKDIDASLDAELGPSPQPRYRP